MFSKEWPKTGEISVQEKLTRTCTRANKEQGTHDSCQFHNIERLRLGLNRAIYDQLLKAIFCHCFLPIYKLASGPYQVHQLILASQF